MWRHSRPALPQGTHEGAPELKAAHHSAQHHQSALRQGQTLSKEPQSKPDYLSSFCQGSRQHTFHSINLSPHTHDFCFPALRFLQGNGHPIDIISRPLSALQLGDSPLQGGNVSSVNNFRGIEIIKIILNPVSELVL